MLSEAVVETTLRLIAERIAERALTQAEVAARAKISQSTLSRLLDRKMQPRTSTLLRVAEAVGVPLDLFSPDAGHIKPIRSQLEEVLRGTERWSSTVAFRDMGSPRLLDDVFVDPFFIPYASYNTAPNLTNKLSISDLLLSDKNYMLLGDPGSGKTTSLKLLAKQILRGANQRFPIVIQLRDVADGDLGTYFYKLLTGQPGGTLEDAIRIANRIRAMILVDGLDELSPNYVVARQIHALLDTAVDSRVIVTCRTGAYTYRFSNADVVRLAPFSREQVTELASRWLGSAEKSERFLTEMMHVPWIGTEIRPLTLVHLLALYQHSGAIPERPRTIYRKIVRLLLEDWDEQRFIHRTSRYLSFSTDRKEEFLEALAYRLIITGAKGGFDHSQGEDGYLDVYEEFALPRYEMNKVLREIESHTGLILETQLDEYEFAHLSIQEYLAASHVLKLPYLPKEAASAPEVLAIALALSARPEIYLQELFSSGFLSSPTPPPSFIYSFLKRLAIERPDLRAIPAVGWLILVLMSRLLEPNRDSDASDVEMHASFVELIFSSAEVSAAIRSVLPEVTMETGPDSKSIVLSLDLLSHSLKVEMQERAIETSITLPHHVVQAMLV